MLRALIACVAFTVALAGAEARAQAPTEAQLAVAREVVTLSGGEASLQDMMDTMRPMMRTDLMSRGMSGEQADRYVGLFIEEFRQEVPRILELAAVAYANAFTQQQLVEIRAFYQTETGRVLAAKLPELSGAMARAGALIGEEIAPRALERYLNGQSADPS